MVAWEGTDAERDVPPTGPGGGGAPPDTDRVPEFAERDRVPEAVRRTCPAAALPALLSFPARRPHPGSGRETERRTFSLGGQTFGHSFSSGKAEREPRAERQDPHP